MVLPSRRCLRYNCRRHLVGLTYHVGLTVFVTIAVLKIVGVSQFPDADEADGGAFMKRGVGVTNKISRPAAIVEIDNGRPFVRREDGREDGWIQLVKQKGTGSGYNDGLLKSKSNNHLRDSIDSLEVLGEGEMLPDLSRRDFVIKSLKFANHPELPDANDIPISKELQERIMSEKIKRSKSKAESISRKLTPSIQDEKSKNHSIDSKQKQNEDIQTQKATHIEVHKEIPVDFPNKHTVPTASSGGLSNAQFFSDGDTKAKRVNVLIVAAMRTGSSFLGELFLERNDFFYMFEPGRLLMHKLDELGLTRVVMVTKLIQMLENFYQCKFQDMQFFIDRLNSDTLRGRKQAVPLLVTDQFCVLHEFKRFKFRRPKDECKAVTEDILETACTGRAHTAIKSIRILDINLVLKLIEGEETDLKLIHLVRDPRSMILSRLKLAMPHIRVFNVTELSETYRNILLKYCSSWHQNYEIGHYVPFVQKNYLMVRYEDIARDPYGSARKIYKFVGLGTSIPSSVRNWIIKNTNANDQSKKKSVSFSTKRDSKSVLVSWKSRLTVQMARAIEEIGDCSRLMQATGYTLIGNDPRMLSNSDSLVGPLPLPKFNASAFTFM
ncbi:carbohydrate sulfotransferase 1-like [Lytechinus pictus]|uniref:carbohydrate sulfotransferase 1-like n=1 Tax=Lytechinus pictus TaxID=7653 RepID=UPI0030BA162A